MKIFNLLPEISVVAQATQEAQKEIGTACQLSHLMNLKGKGPYKSPTLSKHSSLSLLPKVKIQKFTGSSIVDSRISSLFSSHYALNDDVARSAGLANPICHRVHDNPGIEDLIRNIVNSQIFTNSVITIKQNKQEYKIRLINNADKRMIQLGSFQTAVSYIIAPQSQLPKEIQDFVQHFFPLNDLFYTDEIFSGQRAFALLAKLKPGL